MFDMMKMMGKVKEMQAKMDAKLVEMQNKMEVCHPTYPNHIMQPFHLNTELQIFISEVP